MPYKSRWSIPIPQTSIPAFLFGNNSLQHLPDVESKLFISTKDPNTSYLTLHSFREWSKCLAAGLQQAGLQPSDRVMLFSGNSLFTPIVLMGIIMAGGMFTSANPSFTPRELAYQMDNFTPRFVLAAEEQIEVAIEGARLARLDPSCVFAFHALDPLSLGQHPHNGGHRSGKRNGSNSWTELLGPIEAGQAFHWDKLTGSDASNHTAMLFYSSGTTRLPKGVEVSHYNIIANIINISHIQGLSDFESLSRSPRGALCALPMYHGLGLICSALIAPSVRLPVYVMERFSLLDFLGSIEGFQITDLLLVPPMVVFMGKSPCVRRFNLSSVKRVAAGAAPLGIEATALFERLWPAGTVKVRQAWGMSE